MDGNYQETKIKKLLHELNTLYSDMQSEGQYANEDDPYTMETIQTMRVNIKYLAKLLYNTCVVFFEMKKCNNHGVLFEKDIYPQLNGEKLFAYAYHEESGDFYSTFMSDIASYLYPFQEFEEAGDELLAKRAGIIYLEHILESSAVILRDLDCTPKSESEVYNAVKLVTKAVFPSITFSTEPFQKMAKCYKPDILLPSLSCAIEYKFADTEARLVGTIDEILEDVAGYSDHKTYKLFYAVFYTKSGIWTRQRFIEVWREKKFPDNWKGIFVEGPTSSGTARANQAGSAISGEEPNIQD